MMKIFLLLLFPFYIFTSDIKQKVETKKARRLKKDVESVQKESKFSKEELKKTLENNDGSLNESPNLSNPENSSKSSITSPEESATIRNKSPKLYDIKSKGLKLKELDEYNSGKRHAIVIGINNYQDIAISDLSKARNDAKIVGKILKDQGQFDQVFVMTDDIDPRNDKDNLYPTKLNIEEKLDAVLRFSDPDDLFIFYFSGHGISDPIVFQ